MSESNGEKKWLKQTLWTILWALLIGSYAWTAWAFYSVSTEVITNERNNIQCHTQITKEVTDKIDELKNQQIIPLIKQSSAICAKMGIDIR